MAGQDLKKVDHAALRSNQAFIILTLLIAFVLNATWLVAGVGALMLIATMLGTQAFRWLYRGALVPLGVVRPDPIPDHPTPHRFAQGLGGLFLALATLALGLALPLVGWTLAWVVILLAAVNLSLNFCVGCFVYYWLARWRVPGFSHRPPQDTFPGVRPPRG